jgi:flagellum-specific ATP synthase
MTGRPRGPRFDDLSPARRVGAVVRVASGYVVSQGPMATTGDVCEIDSRRNHGGDRGRSSATVLAEVAGVRGDQVTLVPLQSTWMIDPDARVVLVPSRAMAPVGEAFAGRAVDALGRAIDGRGDPVVLERIGLAGTVMAPMERIDPSTRMETGVKAIDALMPIGKGQRLGVFAASGVGKTTLLRQLFEQIQADHVVICLVGERGREVESIWSGLQNSPNLARFTCVAATSDQSAAVRVKAVQQALCLGEYWRSLGRDVLLVVDSITRYAMALREIGLASGAPPTLRSYTPNVFSELPRVVERCGASRAGGSISAIFTVLSETDDVDDPIVEVMKSLLDGHIILSRQLAEQAHFPAIDPVRSVSRQAEALGTTSQTRAARSAIGHLARYDESRIMIESGVYKPGMHESLDRAVRLRPRLMEFLRQGSKDPVPAGQAIEQLERLIMEVTI